MSRISAMAFLASTICSVAPAAGFQQLDSVMIDATEVADSGSYYLYSYSIANPSSSTWNLATVKVDIGASNGTPANLAVTGDLFDLTTSSPGEPHAEVGPITPLGWEAALLRTAELWWYPPSTGASTSDSIVPGQAKSGFGLRSSYLPGIRAVTAEPTVESCCLDPGDTTNGVFYPSSEDFAVAGSAVIPRYQPNEVTVTLLQSQFTAVCTDPLWLDDSELCTQFGDLLDLAESDEDDNNFHGVAAVLNRFAVRVDEEEGSMDGNAYWLLSLNAEQAAANALDTATAAADLWHFRTTVNNAIVSGGSTLSEADQSDGSIAGSIGPSTAETFYFVKPVTSSSAFADGDWSVQLELFEFTTQGSGLVLGDVAVHRYSVEGSLLETKYLHQGDLQTVPAGASRVSLTNTLTGWSSGGGDDWLVLTVRLENEHATASENYAFRAGTDPNASWGASWLSQPK